MWYPSCLGESIDSLSYTFIDVSIVWFFLDILFFNRFLWYHRYLYHDIFFRVHHIVQVKIFHVHAHVPCFGVWCGTINMDFLGSQVLCWCTDISWVIYRISSYSDSFTVSLCFLRSDITYWSHVGCLSVLRFFLAEDEFYCVCYCIFLSPLV